MKRFGALLASLMLIPISAPHCLAEGPKPAAVTGFDTYVEALEARLAEQHRSADGFIAGLDEQRNQQLRRGDLVIEELTPESGKDLPGTMLHDWRGTAFAPGATVAGFEQLMKDYPEWPRIFAPQVPEARQVGGQGDHVQAWMRVRQHHVITVVLDSTYDVTFARLDSRNGYSISRSTHIAEVDAKGRELPPGEGHGFLWRMNTYWSYAERDGGLYLQIESVSLTRSIPRGLGWAVGPFVQSVPRDSLAFTLRAACNAVRKAPRPPDPTIH